MKKIIIVLVMIAVVGSAYSFDIERFYWTFKDFEMSERTQIGFLGEDAIYARWAHELFEADINQYYLMFGKWGVQVVDVYDLSQFYFTIMLPQKESGVYFSLTRYIIIEKDPIGSPPLEEIYFDESGTIFYKSEFWSEVARNLDSSYYTYLVPWEGERLPDSVIDF